MEKLQSPKRQTFRLICWAMLVLASITAAGLFAVQRFTAADASWQSRSNQAKEVNEALSELILHIGYGGLIHNFKNLVLRRDLTRYQAPIENDILRTRASLERLDRLLLLPQEQAALAAVRATLEEYARNFDQATLLIKAGKSAAEIDAVVKVSDKAALAALSYLTKGADQRLADTKKEVAKLQSQGQILATLGGLMTVAAILGSAFMIGFLRKLLAANKVLLHDKQALMMEVHHRVKNNLQVIISLLRLEGRRSQDGAVKTVMIDMQARIRAMAQLHEMLYQSDTLAAVDLGAYLEKLAQQAFKSQSTHGDKVELQCAISSLHVSMDQASSCGLLINELISNCLKHGFPDGRPGVIALSLRPASGAGHASAARWVLCVSDTGMGLPADFEQRSSKSLGLQLVRDLCRQIDGDLVIDSSADKGAKFTLTFEARAPTTLPMPTEDAK